MNAQQAGVISGILRAASQGSAPPVAIAAASAFMQSAYFEAVFGRNADSQAETDAKWAELIALDYTPADFPFG